MCALRRRQRFCGDMDRIKNSLLQPLPCSFISFHLRMSKACLRCLISYLVCREGLAGKKIDASLECTKKNS